MIGFTGTRHGMTDYQRPTVASLLKLAMQMHLDAHPDRTPPPIRFHHGLCVGSDEDAHAIARGLGYRTVGHPASNVAEKWQSDVECDERHFPEPALERDRLIAGQPILIAAPLTPFEVRRSGTWSTIRRGWKSPSTVVYIVRPDGSCCWTTTSETS